MSKLFLIDSPEVLRRVKGHTIHTRRRSPLHPEEIEERFREKAAQNSLHLAPPAQKWLLILWVNESEKHYSNLQGTYKDVVKSRDAILECCDYYAATLVLKTNGYRG